MDESKLAQIVKRSKQMDRDARSVSADAISTIRLAREMRERLTPQLEQMAKANPRFWPLYRASILEKVLDRALQSTQAIMGNVQLLDADSGALRIVAQRGFSKPFLTFFDSVHSGQAACGTAFDTGAQIAVEDVAESPIFLGTPALEVVLDARVRAVLSTPLIGCSGKIIGTLSTHWAHPRLPSKLEMREIRMLALHAAGWIEQRMHLGPSASPGPAI